MVSRDEPSDLPHRASSRHLQPSVLARVCVIRVSSRTIDQPYSTVAERLPRAKATLERLGHRSRSSIERRL
jgi:hypothetical protein